MITNILTFKVGDYVYWKRGNITSLEKGDTIFSKQRVGKIVSTDLVESEQTYTVLNLTTKTYYTMYRHRSNLKLMSDSEALLWKLEN